MRGSQLLTIPTNCTLLCNNLWIDLQSDILLEAPTTTFPICYATEFLSRKTPQRIPDARAALEVHKIRPAAKIQDRICQDDQLREANEIRDKGSYIVTVFYASLAVNLVVVLAILARCGFLWRQHCKLPPPSTSPTNNIELASISPKPNSTTDEL